MRVLSIFIICLFLMACKLQPGANSKIIESVIPSLMVSIDTESLEDITASNLDHFMVSGSCSEEEQPIMVNVEGLTPITAPICSNEAWTATLDLTSLSRASRRILITADHTASNGLAASQATGSVLLYPTVSISTESLGNITISSAVNFEVYGSCSEEGQPIHLDVGGLSPTTAPTCSGGTWETRIDLTGLTGASRIISVTADHPSLEESQVVTQTIESLFFYPRVSIDVEPLVGITATTAVNFEISGSCSEEGQPIIVSVGGLRPPIAPTCFGEVWTTGIDLSSLSGASRIISITAYHATSEGLAIQIIGSALFYPTLSIDIGALEDITAINEDNFEVSGNCSEEGQPIIVRVGGLSPTTPPNCSSGAWTVGIDLSSLSGASRTIAITADHSTSSDSTLGHLAAAQAMGTVILHPRVSIDSSLAGITATNAANFIVSGRCSEQGQPVTIRVGGLSPTTPPNCSGGAWTARIDLSSLGGASRTIAITVDHSTSGDVTSSLDAIQATETVLLHPRVSIATDLAGITATNAANFIVSGRCSEEGQPITVNVGTINPTSAPNCFSEAWTTRIDLSSLSGASRTIFITAGHSTSGELAAAPATGTVLLHPRVSIDTSLAGITATNAARFVVSGRCSEQGQPITVVVGVGAGGLSPITAPNCSSGVWTARIDLSSLSGASRTIPVTVAHSTSSDSTSGELAATPAMGTVIFHPRVSIDAGLAGITATNAAHFEVSGKCSEEGQPVTISVGGLSPTTPPNCSSGAWTARVDLSSLSGASRTIPVTVAHSTSGQLAAVPATGTVLLHPRVSIDTGLASVTVTNAAHFVVSGRCSEEGQPVTINVGTITPTPAPNCTSEAWTIVVDVTGLNKTQSISITADHSTSSDATSGQLAALRATETVTNSFTCPENYVGVPELSGYTTNSFCIMKYEAKNDGSNNALSRPSGTPYGSINRDEAITKCTALNSAGASNYDLVTNDEWQSLARNIELTGSNWGTGVVGSSAGLSIGHADSSPPSRQAASSDDNNGCFGTQETCDGETWHLQRRTHTLSNGEIIWDVSGNVSEWVKDSSTFNYGADSYASQVTTGTHTASGRLSGGTTTTSRVAKNQFGPSGNYSNLMSASYGGVGYMYLNYTLGGVFRGSNYGVGNTAGVFSISLFFAATERSPSLGFRCVYHPAL